MEASVLRKLPLFSSLAAEDLQAVAAIVRTRRVEKGEVLFTEGEPGLGLWLVHKGAVKLVKTDSAGREQLLKTVEPHEFFAEVVLFDGGSYPATAIAASEGEVGILYNADACQLLQAHPNLAWHFLKVLSARLRRAQGRIQILCQGDAAVKIAATLLYLAHEKGTESIAIGQQDLADMAGVARETVTRALATFSREGLIVAGRKKITLKDKERLMALAPQG